MTLPGSLPIWAAVVLLGAFHGANPAMGWLFAVSNGMFERRGRAVIAALPPIALGHLLAMALVLLPVAVVAALASRMVLVRAVAALVIIAFGIYRLIVRRHPRVLARIGAGNLTLWSFVMATAHGAALMLVPVYLGMRLNAKAMPTEADHALGGMHASAMEALGHASAGLALAATVAVVHTAAMLLVAGTIAWVFYRYFGLTLLRRVWFNVDVVWAAALILAGIVTLLSV